MPTSFKYEADWKGFDRGREGLLNPNIWFAVLEILSRHEGTILNAPGSAMYSELEERFPEIEWISPYDPSHNLFRDHQTTWTLTGVLLPTKETKNKIEITPLGRALLDGKLSITAIWTQAMAVYTEKSGVRSFSVLAKAFLALKSKKLTLPEIYYGIERGWRPEEESAPIISEKLPITFPRKESTPGRRLRAMLKLLVTSGALAYDGTHWKARNRDILQAIASGTTITAQKHQESQKQPSIVENATEKNLEELGDIETALPVSIREIVMRSIAVRRGQPLFRKVLLGLYSHKCAVSGWDANVALEAAHILPVASNGNHEPSNGLLLRADLHTLFDLHYIGVNPKTMLVSISPFLLATRYNEFNGQPINMPISVADQPDKSALAKHYKVFCSSK